jgi:hypothetical protein
MSTSCIGCLASAAVHKKCCPLPAPLPVERASSLAMTILLRILFGTIDDMSSIHGFTGQK